MYIKRKRAFASGWAVPCFLRRSSDRNQTGIKDYRGRGFRSQTDHKGIVVCLKTAWCCTFLTRTRPQLNTIVVERCAANLLEKIVVDGVGCWTLVVGCVGFG